MEMKINVVNRGHQPLPAYATEQSAGMDLRANIDQPVVLRPMERRLIPTGLHIALPQGYEAQVRPRSGLALKHGIEEIHVVLPVSLLVVCLHSKQGQAEKQCDYQ